MRRTWKRGSSWPLRRAEAPPPPLPWLALLWSPPLSDHLTVVCRYGIPPLAVAVAVAVVEALLPLLGEGRPP